MKQLQRLFILVPMLALLFCGKNVNGPNEGPRPPLLWPAPNDTALVEKGIDTIPEADVIQLDWTLTDDKDIDHILLFRRSEKEEQFKSLRKFGRKDTTWIDNDHIELNIRYYYYLRAVDRDDRQGAPSDTVDYMLIDKAYNLYASSGTHPLFRWQIQDYYFHEYIIKILDANSGEKIWFARVTSDHSDLDEEVKYNFNGGAKYDSLKINQNYIWRVDIVGAAKNCGSESMWQQLSPS